MTTVAPDRQTEPTPIRTPRRSRWLVPLAVAAAVATVASTPAVVGRRRQDEQESPDVTFQAAPDSPGTGYRAVLTAPGWQADYASEDDKYGGEVGFTNGGQHLAITWYPEKTYQDYLLDRQHIAYRGHRGARATRSRCSGVAGQLWAYDDTDHTVMREPDAGPLDGVPGRRHGPRRLRGAAHPSQAGLAGGVRVGAPVVVRHRRGPTGGRPEDPRRHRGGHRRDGSGRHHPGHPVRRAGPLPARRRHRRCSTPARGSPSSPTPRAPDDQARADEAARVMGTSRQWPVLQEMDADGDYPEVVWDVRRQMAAGQVPAGDSAAGSAGRRRWRT